MSRRRSDAAFGFVNWPEPDIVETGLTKAKSGIVDTGEGGMECWLLVYNATRGADPDCGRGVVESVRDIAVTGLAFGVVEFNAVPDEEFLGRWQATQSELVRSTILDRQRRSNPGFGISGRTAPLPVEAAICIGATGRSLYSLEASDYWRPEPGEPDLTAEGVVLYDLMLRLYGFDSVRVVMALDT